MKDESWNKIKESPGKTFIVSDSPKPQITLNANTQISV